MPNFLPLSPIIPTVALWYAEVFGRQPPVPADPPRDRRESRSRESLSSPCRIRPWLVGCRRLRSGYPIHPEERREITPEERCRRRHAKLPQRVQCEREAARREAAPREDRDTAERRDSRRERRRPQACRIRPWLQGCR